MKKNILIGVLALFVVMIGLYAFLKDAASQNVATNVVSEIGEKIEDSKLIVYYFHTTFRCVSCKNIEKYTKEAINRYFADEIKSGKIDFKILNVEEPQNKHFMKDYQLYTKSVVLSKLTAGKEERYKNLDKVWQLLRNKEKFYSYIKDETEKFLN